MLTASWLRRGRLGRRVDALLSEELTWVGWSLESLLKEAAQILAQVSGYLAMITLPQASAVSIRHNSARVGQ